MQTKLIIECDIKLAQAILLAASKIIDDDEFKQEEKVREMAGNQQGISVYQWAELELGEQTEYDCIDGDGNRFDIAFFGRTVNKMSCELCIVQSSLQNEIVMGTGDTREPKYCLEHYIMVNRGSRFVKKEGY